VSRVHIIGAGLAGLSAAVALTQAGRAVTLHEAGPAAGGRARSYFDRGLGLRIDNGNHLLLSGNTATMAYLDTIGARGTLTGPGAPVFPFIDIPSGRRWMLRPGTGRIPWWILTPSRRVPETRPRDYLRLAGVARIADDRSVAESLPHDVLYRRLLEPLAVAALNTPPEQGLARLLGAVLRETLLRGGAACVPCLPREGLSETLVDPALGWLHARGAALRFGHRIAGLETIAERVVGLRGPDGPIPLGAQDAVVLAVPPWVATDLLPGLTAPDEFQAILNIHFRCTAPPPPTDRADTAQAGFVGLVGGTTEWVFVKPGHVSATISAANRLVDRPAEAIAAAAWPDVQAALRLPASGMPAYRVVKERRATFAATAAQERRRPGPRAGLANLALAGDWTATGLPATIEGAIRSGHSAARALPAI
jgi:squalene-associated FAD-dependent desaturase